MEKEPNTQEPIIDYDGRWKTIIEELFDDFMAFFMPKLFEQIDFSKEIAFLDKELQKIIPQAERKGKRLSDCLVKVFLKSGEEKWILVHIEIQSSYNANFSARMFKYFYRIFDKYERKIAAIAIFTDEKHPKNCNVYNDEFFGTHIIYKYNTYKISEQSIASLEQQKNPFALAVLANKYVLASKKKKHQRLQFKFKLLELMRKCNFPDKKISAVFKFIKYLMLLPKDLELQFENNLLETYKNHINMRDVVFEPELLALLERCIVECHGDTLENLLAKEREKEREKTKLEREKTKLEREKAKQEREKAKQEREKAKQEREKTIMNLHKTLNLNALQIAKLIEIEPAIVTAIIEKNT